MLSLCIHPETVLQDAGGFNRKKFSDVNLDDMAQLDWLRDENFGSETVFDYSTEL